MEEKDLYEQIGRLSIKVAEEERKVLDCLSVIHRIKIGEIDLNQLVTTEISFSLTPTTTDDLLRD